MSTFSRHAVPAAAAAGAAGGHASATNSSAAFMRNGAGPHGIGSSPVIRAAGGGGAAPAPPPRAYVDDRVRILVKHPRERSSREIDDLLDFTRSIAFFNTLPPLVHQGLVRAATVREFEAREIVCRQGDAGDCFYIILVGQIGVWIDPNYAANVAAVMAANAALKEQTASAQQQQNESGSATGEDGARAHHRSNTTVGSSAAPVAPQLQPLPLPKEPTGQPLATKAKGDSFGELALLENQPRNATIVALVPTLLMRLDRVDYLSLLKQHQDALLRDKVDFLLSVDLFSAWSRADVTSVSYFFHERSVACDELVDEHDGIIILKDGHANLVTRSKEQCMGEEEEEEEEEVQHAQRQHAAAAKEESPQQQHQQQQQPTHSNSGSSNKEDGHHAVAKDAAAAANSTMQASPHSTDGELSPQEAGRTRDWQGAAAAVLPPSVASVATAATRHHHMRMHPAHAAHGHAHTAAGSSSTAASAAAAPPAMVRACIVEHLECLSVFGENRAGRGKTHLMWSSVRYWRERALRCTSERGMRVLHISVVDFNAQIYRQSADSRRRMDLLQLRRDALSKPPFTRTPAEIDVLVAHYTSARYQSSASTAMGGGSGIGGSGGAALLGPGMKKHAFLELLTERGRRHFFQAMSVDVVNARRIVVQQDEPAELLYVLLSGSACLFAAANSNPSNSSSNQQMGAASIPTAGASSSGSSSSPTSASAGGGGAGAGTGGGSTSSSGSGESSNSMLHLVNIQRGDTIGELSLLTSSPYCVTVVAATTCEFATFRRADFAHMLAAGWHPRSHMSYTFLQSLDIFSGATNRGLLREDTAAMAAKTAAAAAAATSVAGPPLNLDGAVSTASLALSPSAVAASSSSHSALTAATHPQRLIRLVYAVKYLHIGVSEVLLRQGEQADGVFFVVQGKCAATTEVQVRKAAEQAQQQKSTAKNGNDGAVGMGGAGTTASSSLPLTSAASATQSVHHRLHAPRIKPLEIAQLSTGEQFGEGCLFAKTPTHSSSSSSSSSSSNSNTSNSAASSGILPLGVSTDHRSPVTITTSTKCKLLYISAERLQLLISSRTLQRFKRIYQLKRQWRSERIRELMANFRTVIAAPGRAPVTPRAAAASVSRGGIAAAYAAASAAIEIKPLASKQRSRILTHVSTLNGTGSAVQPATNAPAMPSTPAPFAFGALEDPANVTPAPGGSVAASMGSALQQSNAEANFSLSDINSAASAAAAAVAAAANAAPAQNVVIGSTIAPGTTAPAPAGPDVAAQNAMLAASAAASAFAAASAVIPRHQWRVRDRVPRNLFQPSFKPVYATSLTTVRRGPGGRITRKNLMRSTIKIKPAAAAATAPVDGSSGAAGAGAAGGAEGLAAVVAAAAAASETSSSVVSALRSSSLEHSVGGGGGGPGTLVVTVQSLASQRWKFALSCISAQCKLKLQSKTEMYRALTNVHALWEFKARIAGLSDDSFLPLPPTTFAGVFGSTAPQAPPMPPQSLAPTAASRAHQLDMLSPQLQSLLMDARAISLSDAVAAGVVPASPNATGASAGNAGSAAGTGEDMPAYLQAAPLVNLGALSPAALNSHFASILARMGEAQSSAARVIRDTYDRPTFVREEDDGAVAGNAANATHALAHFNARHQAQQAIARRNQPAIHAAAGVVPGANTSASGGDAIHRYRAAMLKSCALPSWVHAKLPKSLASRPSQDMFGQPKLLLPPQRVRRRVKKSWEVTSSDEEEEAVQAQVVAAGRGAKSSSGGGGLGSQSARSVGRRGGGGASSLAGVLVNAVPVESAAEKAAQLELAKMKNLWAQSWSGINHSNSSSTLASSAASVGVSGLSSSLSDSTIAPGLHYHGLGDVRFRSILSPSQAPNVFPYTSAANASPEAQAAFWASQAKARAALVAREHIEVYSRNAATGALDFQDGSIVLETREIPAISGNRQADGHWHGAAQPIRRNASSTGNGGVAGAAYAGAATARTPSEAEAPPLKDVAALLPVSVLAPVSKGVPPLFGSVRPPAATGGTSIPATSAGPADPSTAELIAAHLSVPVRSPAATRQAHGADDPEEVLDGIAANGGVYVAASADSAQARQPASQAPTIMKVAGIQPGTTERQLRWCFEGVQVEVRRVRMQQAGREGLALVEYWPLGVPARRVKRTVYERLFKLQGGVSSTDEKNLTESTKRGGGEAPRFFGLDTSSSVTDRRARLLAKVAVDMGVREKFHTLLSSTPQLNAVHHRVDRAALARTEHAALGADIKSLQGGHELPTNAQQDSDGLMPGHISTELSALFRPEQPPQPSALPQRTPGAPLGPSVASPSSKRSSQHFSSMSSGSTLAISVDASGASMSSPVDKQLPQQSVGGSVSSVSSSVSPRASLRSSGAGQFPNGFASASGSSPGSSAPTSATEAGAKLNAQQHLARPPVAASVDGIDRRGMVSPRRASAFQRSKREAALAEQKQREEMKHLAVGERAALEAEREERMQLEAALREQKELQRAERRAQGEPELTDEDDSDLEPEAESPQQGEEAKETHPPPHSTQIHAQVWEGDETTASPMEHTRTATYPHQPQQQPLSSSRLRSPRSPRFHVPQPVSLAPTVTQPQLHSSFASFGGEQQQAALDGRRSDVNAAMAPHAQSQSTFGRRRAV